MIDVLVVDDSAFSRKIITNILEAIPGVRVLEAVRDGQEAIQKTVLLKPDLITLDLEMPRMNGFTFLRWLMTYQPTPVIVVSAQEADESVFKALDLGALDFVVKPTRHASLQLQEIEADLIEKVLAVPMLAKAKLRQTTQHFPEIKYGEPKTRTKERPRLIGIGSSTGGPSAIQTILRSLPKNFPVPILVAQHMPPGFTTLFADRLNKVAQVQVKEAADTEALQAGTLYIAPGGKHLEAQRQGAHLVTHVHKDARQPHRHFPSADILLTSLASEAGACVIGVVLTGMGDDGKLGLQSIKTGGGVTIAESEETAIIFGMPKEAIKAGIVDFVLPLHEIGHALISLSM